MAVPRFLYTNAVQGASAVLTASSEATAFPVANLSDQLRSLTWRSVTGWTFKQGFNDALSFSTADGPRLGYIAPLSYVGGSGAATAIAAAYNAAGYNPKTSFAGLTGWYRADAATLDANGLVNVATDLSGNGRDLTQGTAAQRPTWVADAIDGRPGWYWNGTADMNLPSAGGVTMANYLGTDGIGTIITVCRLDSDAAANDILWHAGSGSEFMYLIWTGTTNFASVAYDTASRTATDAAATGPAILHSHIWRYDLSNLGSSVDSGNTAAFTNTAATSPLHANILASTFKIGNPGADLFKGYIFEVLVFNRGLAEAERQGVLAYLKARYPSMVDNSTAVGWTVTLGVTYDTSTKKFTTARTGGAGNISLLGNTASPAQDKACLAFKDQGYSVVADLTGATTYTAALASYQSRHWVKVDLATATAITAGQALDHNAGSAGTFTLEGNDYDLFIAPATSLSLTGTNATVRLAYQNSASRRWWRLVIDDVQNPVGYSELGIWYVGGWVAPSFCHSDSFAKSLDELSVIGYGTHGSHMVDDRPQRWAFSLPWSEVPEADRTLFELLATTLKVGQNFTLQFDSSDVATAWYVMRRDPLTIAMASAFPYWNLGILAVEALD